jgi:hypothetical protein
MRLSIALDRNVDSEVREFLMTATLAIVVAASLMVAPAMAQQPASPPTAPATAPAAAAPAADTAAQEPLPSAAEIFKKNLDARGGEASLRRHTSMTQKGTFAMPGMGLEGTLVIQVASPSFSLVTIDAPGLGVISQGYDGTVGWSDNPMTGPTLTTGKELELSQLQSDLHADLNFEKHFAKIEVVGRETFAGEPCYKVALTTHGGIEMFNYFSVATGLMMGSTGNLPTPMGDAFVEVVVSGYKEFEGVLYPTQTLQKAMGAEQVLTITEMDFSAIDPSVFALPESVKTLAAAQQQ